MECLDQSKGVLLLPLSWEPSFNILSNPEKNRLERAILETLHEKDITKSELLDNLDYEMISVGIKDLNDPIQRRRLNTELGYEYLLGLSLGETSDSGEWDYQTFEDKNALYPVWREELEVNAVLRVVLIKISNGIIVSDHTVETTISEIPFSDKDGGTNYRNFGTISAAVSTAVIKGIESTAKDCKCDSSLQFK